MRTFAFLLLAALLAGGEEEPAALHLTLESAIRTAHAQGREMIAQREDLELADQALANALGDYGPIPHGSLSAGYNGVGSSGRPGETRTATLGVNQSLPTGGTASADVSATRTRPAGTDTPSSAGTATVGVKQPLLRGGGLTAWREPRLRAERSRIYFGRSFASFREQLTIDSARTFWGLQRQEAAVGAARAGLANAEFSTEQSKALMAIGRSQADDVFRAETNLMQAHQAVIDEEAAFAAAIDQIKVDLALDPRLPIVIDPTPPPLVLLSVDPAAAISAALTQRRDLATARDRMEDADRALALARRDMLPDLSADGSATWGGGLESSAGWEDQPAWQVAITLQLPLDQRSERTALRQAEIERLRAIRSERELRERTIAEVRDAIRRLRTADTTLTLQQRNRVQARRRAEKAALDFKAGTGNNRDLIEAQNEVRSADDAHYAAIVAYRIADLELRRSTATLVLAEDGTWDQQPPPYASIPTP